MAYFIMPGDSKELLKGIPDNSIDSVVCDPPYDLVSIQKRFGKPDSVPAKEYPDGGWTGNGNPYERTARGFMGKTWDGTGIAFDRDFWREVLRVLKPGGHLAAFGGSRTYHRMAVAIEDAGFEIRDSLFWIYGSGFPKSHDIGKAIDKKAGVEREVIGEVQKLQSFGKTGDEAVNAVYGSGPDKGGVMQITAPATEEAKRWDGWGTALKPAHEPIVLARKPISESSIAANVLRWGTGAINIGASRVHLSGGRNPSGSGNSLGYHGRGTGTGGNRTPDAGRWPANVLLTCCGMIPHREGCPMLELDRQSGLGGSNFRKNKGSGTFQDRSMFRASGGYTKGQKDSGGASRFFAELEQDADLDELVPFFYSAKASREERDLGLGELEPKAAHELVDRKPGTAGLNSPRAGAGRTSGGRNTHPTVKPVRLVEWLIKLLTPPGGVTLDTFMGSGSTGMAAVLNGFDYIGMELTPEYIPIATGRIAWAAKKRIEIENSPRQGTIFDAIEEAEGVNDGLDDRERMETEDRTNRAGGTAANVVRSYQLPFAEIDGDAQDLPNQGLREA